MLIEHCLLISFTVHTFPGSTLRFKRYSDKLFLWHTTAELPEHHSTKSPYWWVIGSMGVALALIALSLLALVLWKFFRHNLEDPDNQRKSPDSDKFQLLKSGSFCYGSGRYLCCQFGNARPTRVDGGDHHINVPKGQCAAY
jgi:hypothetical protein